MRITFTIFLLVLTLVLGGLTAIQKVSGNLDSIFGAPPLAEGDTLYRFDKKDVYRIEILNHDGTKAVIKKKNGAWMLEEPWDDLADSRLIQSVINFSNNLIIEDVIERDEVDDLAKYGLRSARIEVQLFSTDGESICHYRLGHKTAWRTSEEVETVIIRPAERDQKDNIYVCADVIDANIRQVRIREIFGTGLKLFRDHRAFYNHPALATGLTLKDQSSTISLKRANLAKNTPWRITQPFDLAADKPSVEKLIKNLGDLQGTEVLDPSAITLPAPTPENIERTLRADYTLPNGKTDSVSLFIYPPEQEDSPTVFARVGQSLEKLRPAVLRLIRQDESAKLNQLPQGVNELRSRTLTSLSIAQLESLHVRDAQGKTLNLNLEWNPHERAKRWHARTNEYQGPANEEQVKNVFEILFKNPIIRFADDAATDLKDYGLAKPERTVTLTLKDGKKLTYLLGQRYEDHFFARLAGGDRALPLTQDLYQGLTQGKNSEYLTALFSPETTGLYPVENPQLFGFHRPKIIQVQTNQGAKKIELGTAKHLHFYASEKDSKRVSEVPRDFLYGIQTDSFRWRQTRLWNLNAFEVRGMIIERKGRPALTLKYNFFRQEWRAEQNGTDVTAKLNTNKAERLLEKLADMNVLRWLGPADGIARERLRDPNLTVSVLTEEVNSDGETTGIRSKVLKIARVNPTRSNTRFYGQASNEQDLFLLDLGTVKRLAVQLLE